MYGPLNCSTDHIVRMVVLPCRLDDFAAAFTKMQNVCGRTATAITTCSLVVPTGALAARAPSVQARIEAVMAAPETAAALQQAAADAATAEAANAAEPFVDPRPFVVPSSDLASAPDADVVPADAIVATGVAADAEGGRKMRMRRLL